MSDPKGQQIDDEMVYPANRKLAAHLRAGDSVKGFGRTALKSEWGPNVADRLADWLRTGDLEPLVRLLREEPFVIAHPVVFRQIVHLRRLSRRDDKGDIAELAAMGASVSPEEEESAPPAGTRKAARDALARVVSAWVQAVLPGWTLNPPRPRRPRGRPGTSDTEEELELLASCYELLSRFDEIRASRPLVLIRRAAETREGYGERIARAVIPAVHAENPYAAYEKQTTPLPVDIAQQIAREAVSGRRVSKRRLAYALLGYYSGRTREQVRGIIERAKKGSN